MRIPYYEVRFLSTLQVSYSPLALAGTQTILYKAKHSLAIRVLFDYLIHFVKNWDFLRLHPLPVLGNTIKTINGYCKSKNFKIYKTVMSANTCLVIDQSWEDYVNSLSQNLRKTVRRAYKSLEKRSYEFREIGLEDNAEEVIELIKYVEEQSWKNKRGIQFSNRENRDFYSQLIRNLLPLGYIRIYMLMIDGKPAAYDLHTIYNGVVKTLKGSYVEQYAEYSPGTLLTWHAFEKFFQEGIKHIDQLWGNLAYKTRWMNKLVAHARIIVVNKNNHARLIDFLQNVRNRNYKSDPRIN